MNEETKTKTKSRTQPATTRKCVRRHKDARAHGHAHAHAHARTKARRKSKLGTSRLDQDAAHPNREKNKQKKGEESRKEKGEGRKKGRKTERKKERKKERNRETKKEKNRRGHEARGKRRAHQHTAAALASLQGAARPLTLSIFDTSVRPYMSMMWLYVSVVAATWRLAGKDGGGPKKRGAESSLS